MGILYDLIEILQEKNDRGRENNFEIDNKQYASSISLITLMENPIKKKEMLEKNEVHEKL